MVRRAVPGEEAVVRELRLAALRQDPHAFSSTVDVELARPPDEWADWVDPGPTFLEIDESRPDPGTDGTSVGLVGAIRSSADVDAIELVGLWVAPGARRSGVGSALVDAVLGWAAERGTAEVRVGVAEGNVAAERLYERHGFARTGRVARALRPGVVEMEMARTLPSGSAG